MNTKSKQSLLPAGLFLLSSLLATSLQAEIIGLDNFSDGDRTVADNSGGGPGLVWYTTTNEDASSATLSIVNDDGTPGIGGGNSLNMRPNSSSGNRPVVATFSSPVTLGSSIGDKITASMSLRFISGVDDSDDNTNLSFRFGLFNSNGTLITADGQRFDLENGTGNDFGYFARIPVGDPAYAGNTDARLSKETGVASGTSEDPIFGQDNSSGTGDDVEELGTTSLFPVTISDLDPHFVVFGLERTASGVLTSVQVDGATAFTAEDTSSPFETFDEFAMTNMRITTEWRIDNVEIESLLIPEPSSVVLLLMGLLVISSRRAR